MVLIDVLVELSPTRWGVLAELLSRASLVAVDGANSLAPWALVDLLVDLSLIHI